MKSIISAFADEGLLANYLGISVYPFKTCRVTVKGNSIVLFSDIFKLRWKIFSLGNLPGEKIGHTSNFKFP